MDVPVETRTDIGFRIPAACTRTPRCEQGRIAGLTQNPACRGGFQTVLDLIGRIMAFNGSHKERAKAAAGTATDEASSPGLRNVENGSNGSAREVGSMHGHFRGSIRQGLLGSWRDSGSPGALVENGKDADFSGCLVFLPCHKRFANPIVRPRPKGAKIRRSSAAERVTVNH